MNEKGLTRDREMVQGNVFVAMPYGVKACHGDPAFNFDDFYRDVYSEIITEIGLTPVRADSIYGAGTVDESIWRGMQEAEIVLVDFSTRCANVMLEYGQCRMLNKKMVYLTQDEADIPSNVRGLRYIRYDDDWRSITKMRTELRNQLLALRREPNVEMKLVPMPTGGTVPAPATVLNVTEDLVVVTTEGGRLGVLAATDVDYARILPDMRRRFSVGERLSGAFATDAEGGQRYTLLAGRQNPWPALTRDYAPGRVFTGQVCNVVPGVGAFVRVAHGVNGRVPAYFLADLPAVGVGTEMEVMVDRIDAERRNILLAPVGAGRHRPAGRPSASPERRDTVSGPRVGERLDGEVTKAEPENGRSGGYVLLKVPGRERPVMLHCSRMSAELRADLNRNEIEIGELIYVEVVGVDPVRDRVTVRDIPEEAAADAA
ncbi:S1 RNA-binding domain-containing protein [Microtetraspora niveoalba]|uniref:S1 RNA-binding domain-containing protein n=1 Tax=Microtetraspora niveoalba TaxID=46175 RepID=UPI00082B0033|nr:S1 RNA-binding domain-containing protein [Microtetraspora niveoalba]